MHNWICRTCGTQFSDSTAPPEQCPICEDERQYIGYAGQQWTTLEEMNSHAYRNAYFEHEPNLISIQTVPQFAIGQQALLLRTPEGNILWDCISYIDEVTVQLIQGLGGIQAIAISHPHYYSAMVDWAERFDANIYLHEEDREWVMRPSQRVVFWGGEEVSLTSGVHLVHVGGHFDGAAVLLWSHGAQGKGVLLTGDTIQVVADRKWVSFMYSYPNQIPLPIPEMTRIQSVLSRLRFDRLYGFGFDRIVREGAKDVVLNSIARYIHALERGTQHGKGEQTGSSLSKS